MRLAAVVEVLMAAVCFGQTDISLPTPAYHPAPVPDCDAYTTTVMPQLGFKQKACYYRDQLFTGSAVFGAAFFSGIAQLQHDPEEWGQGAAGFGRRFGTRYTQGMVKSTGSFLFGALNHEDPRPHPPPNPACSEGHQHARKSGFGPRLGDSLLRVVWTHRDNCTDGIAISHFAGALGSGFIGMAWTPDPKNSVGQAFSRSGTAFGGDVAASVFAEFQDDIFSLFSSMFGKGKPKQ